MLKQFPLAASIAVYLGCSALTAIASSPQIELTPISAVRTTPRTTTDPSTGVVSRNEEAAMIVKFVPGANWVLTVNVVERRVDIFDISNPATPQTLSPINVGDYVPDSVGAVPTSAAVFENLIAVAVKATPLTNNGYVLLFEIEKDPKTDERSLVLQFAVEVGALPDMVTFTPNGRHLVVANEGEPLEGVNPEGSVSIVDLPIGNNKARVRTARFNKFDGSEVSLRAKGVRIFPNVTASQDLEPEAIAVSADSQTAWVTLQENNAMAIVDVLAAKVKEVVPLGTKDHSIAGNALDVSDKDGINIQNWPVHGLYQPDEVAAYCVNGHEFLVMANEGSDRDVLDKVRVADAVDKGWLAPELAQYKSSPLGRLNISLLDGNVDDDAQIEKLYNFGGRSFSIRKPSGELVWDSGDQFERFFAANYPTYFNVSHDNGVFDNRSDDKGPEPEAVVIGNVFGSTFAFIGLERIGGVMVYDISNPKAPTFAGYGNNRNFAEKDVTKEESGDLGAEGLAFISPETSPNGKPLVVVGNEISGTTTIYELRQKP